MSTSFSSSGYTPDPAAFAIKRRQHIAFFDPNAAPFNRSVRCQAKDNEGLYVLPFPCIRTDKGWHSARTNTPLHVTVTGWRYSDVR